VDPPTAAIAKIALAKKARIAQPIETSCHDLGTAALIAE
jgi:hypothetical protein